MLEILEITTTVETAEQAKQLASTCVERHCVACVQINGPITSVYRWEGKICTAEEFRCSLKTSVEAGDRVIALLRELHPYDLPEILVERQSCSEDYGLWVAEQVSKF